MKQKTTLLKNILFTFLIVGTNLTYGQTLEAKYEFATDGNLNDASGNSRTLTKIGSALKTFITDNDGNTTSAFDAQDATGEYLVATGYKGIGADGARTVAAWINLRAGGNRRTIVSWGANSSTKMFNVMIEGGLIRVEAGASNIKSSGVVPNGSWHHVAVTYDPNDGAALNVCKMYIDGVLQSIGSNFNDGTSIDTDVATNDVRIGEAVYSTAHFYRGSLNDVSIYSDALTSLQIAALAGVSASPPVADFSVDNVAPGTDDILTFTDASTNSPTSFSWDFGAADAIGDPTAQNPQVAYPTAGTYTVTLTATNAGGSDDEVKTDYITVSAGSGSGDLQTQYNFDGDLTDVSSYGRILTVTGSFVPAYEADADANASSALTASGIYADHLISGYSGIVADGARTVAAWYKTTGTAREPIVSWGDNSAGKMFNVMIDNGVPRVEAGASSLKTTDVGLNDDTWRHIAVTYDPVDGPFLANCKIYVNGILAINEADAGASFQSETTMIDTDATTNFLKIGSAVYSTYTFDGAIDDVRIYSKALTPAEVATVFNRGALSTNTVKVSEFKIFPNPVTDRVTIKTNLNNEFSVSLYNVLGRKVKANILSERAGEVNLGVSEMASGLYFIVVKTDSAQSSFRFIKE